MDRADNEDAYAPLNCVACCSTCNYMKGTRSVASFLDHCERVRLHMQPLAARAGMGTASLEVQPNCAHVASRRRRRVLLDGLNKRAVEKDSRAVFSREP